MQCGTMRALRRFAQPLGKPRSVDAVACLSRGKGSRSLHGTQKPKEGKMRISVEELAGRVASKRYVGLCPFHHEKSPSFYVYRGRDGRARWHCFGCGADGDAIDWFTKVEGGSWERPADSGIKRQRERQRRRETALQEYRDRNPDCVIPDDFLRVPP
jgi:hypothetical protein